MRGSGWHPAAGRWRWGVSSRRPNVRRSQRHLKACSPPAMAATDDAKGLAMEAKQQVGNEGGKRGCRRAGDGGPDAGVGLGSERHTPEFKSKQNLECRLC